VVDSQGVVYVLSQHSLHQITGDGIITTLAGAGTDESYVEDGTPTPAASAGITSATELAMAPDGSLYFGVGGYLYYPEHVVHLGTDGVLRPVGRGGQKRPRHGGAKYPTSLMDKSLISRGPRSSISLHGAAERVVPLHGATPAS